MTQMQRKEDAATLVGVWVGRCRERMKRVAMRYLGGNEDLAEEMVQEACFVALKRAQREPDLVRGVRDPCRWLVVTTVNVVRTWRRNRAVRARLRKENEAEIRLELDPKDDPPVRWLLEERALELARSHLTRTQRAVITLVLEGKTDAEIAAKLAATPATVRSHRSMAVRRMRAATIGESSRGDKSTA